MGTLNSESQQTTEVLSINGLSIPPLKVEANNSVGKIIHIIRPEKYVQVVSQNQINISPRIRENLYVLDNGENIIISDRKIKTRPDGVDGILIKTSENSLRWTSHKLIDEFHDKTNELKQYSEGITKSWIGQFKYNSESHTDEGNILLPGLRPPQIGGLHSIGAHWSTNSQVATIVMPTGTGKTETMISALVAHTLKHVLVVVPSRVLRDQTYDKFANLGKLRELGCIDSNMANPVVGVLKKQIVSHEQLDIFDKCNVVISTMSALTGKETKSLISQIADKIDALYIDEAHHIGAESWTEFREYFKNCKVLQFTATPYRSDGVIVDGKVIFEYSLQQAQVDGYFKHINFLPVNEIDRSDADKAIATTAIKKLTEDIGKNLNHVMMARCSNINRANELLSLYRALAPNLNPVLVNSEISNTTPIIENIRKGNHKIVVCVNMLGEGFDLPELKIAALHDSHKSLAVLLQFIGRFTRTSNSNIGDATVVANIDDDSTMSSLEKLYSEDADWNKVLSEFSSEAAKSHRALIDFLNESTKYEKTNNEETIEISHFLLRPSFNTLIFDANTFNPKKFIDGLNEETEIHTVWLHEKSQTLYFVAKTIIPNKWTRSKELISVQWNLFVLHYDSENKILFVSSSDKTSLHEGIAKAVGASKLISGDSIFRSLGNVNRLIFQNIGVRKYGRRNLRFALYTGADVAEALSITEKTNSIKSNLSGTGWENGMPITIGCSYKGRIWSRDAGTIPEFIEWCKNVGNKIKNENIDTTKIIENVLIPEEVIKIPDAQVLGIDWPLEILRQAENRITLEKNNVETNISEYDLVIDKVDSANNAIDFHLRSNNEELFAEYTFSMDATLGFKVKSKSSSMVNIRIGNLATTLEQYFSDYPPLIRFVDLSELDGNLLVKSQNQVELKVPQDRFEVWDWQKQKVDITKESLWKGNQVRKDSIQWYASEQFINSGFDVVFDDDDAGEVADLICLKNEDSSIRLVLIHCKYSQNSSAGERVKDVVEVCSQAVRSAKWKWKFKDMCRHAINREKNNLQGRSTRLLHGEITDFNKFARLSRFKEIKPEIVIVQPGLSVQNITKEQSTIVAAAYAYLKETIGLDLDIICSE